MFNFDEVCETIEDMHPYTYSALISEKRASVVKSLKDLNKNGLTGLTIYNGLMLGAISSDGKLAEEEFYLMKPTLDAAFGNKLTYKEAKSLIGNFYPGGKKYDQFQDAVKQLFNDISDELKRDIVIVCLLTFGVDGKISQKEKKWLKELLG